MSNVMVSNVKTNFMSKVMGLLMLCLSETALVSYFAYPFATSFASQMVMLFGGFAAAIVFIIWLSKSMDGNDVALLPLMGLTTSMGFMVAPMIAQAMLMPGGVQMIELAALCTIGMTAFFGACGAVFKGSLESLGKFLGMGLIFLIIVNLVGIFISASAYHLAAASAGVVLFSGYIFYDVSNAVRGNYTVMQATVQIYLDVVNLFINILSILMNSSKN